MHRNLALGGYQAVLRNVGRENEGGTDILIHGIAQYSNLHFCKFWNPLADWIARLNQSLLYQHHCCNTKYRLGRTHHYEQSILLHGFVIGYIHEPMRLEVDYFAAPSNGSNSALNSACINMSLYNIVNAI